MISQVIDIVDTMPAAGLYEHFKNQLLEVHQLSEYEKFNVLIKMESLGGRKPSQLLYAMLEFCPVGMEKHLSFHYLYMQRLPQALRTQLGEVQPGDPRGLAARANRLWSVHSPSGSVAAVTDEQDGAAAVAAVKPATRGHGGTPTADPTPSDLARMSSGLCFFHWAFADKASKCVPPCPVGKLGRQGRLNAVVPGSLVHIVDQLSNRRFLVDPGASYSIFPHSSAATPSGTKLRGGAGQLIPCWGEKTMNLSFQGKHFTWTFLLAAVSFPIIGVDFLRHFRLMVDPAANALVDKCSAESFATVSALMAVASADSGPPLAARITGPQSPVLSHRSPVTGPQSPVHSHRSSVTGHQSPVTRHRFPAGRCCRQWWQPLQRIASNGCWQTSRRWLTPPRRYPAAPLAMLNTTSLPRGRCCHAVFAAWMARN
jgi:hypothetical protein